MRLSAESVKPSPLQARVTTLREELAAVTAACDRARQEKRPGELFFLLRKKWTLTQLLFQAESELLLETRAGE